jgi:hypothetical protein
VAARTQFEAVAIVESGEVRIRLEQVSQCGKSANIMSEQASSSST